MGDSFPCSGTMDFPHQLVAAQGYFELGMLDHAWKQLGQLSAEDRACPAALRLRIQLHVSAEAWREGADEYATVAMRFSLNDVMEDRSTGKPAPGSQALTAARVFGTFRRPAGSGPQGWKLSAIQQAA